MLRSRWHEHLARLLNRPLPTVKEEHNDPKAADEVYAAVTRLLINDRRDSKGTDEFHREFYTMESSDRKKQSSWSRDLRYAGVHIMQCHASTEDKACWANWCVLICHADSLPYAERWLQLYPGCVDPSKINRG